MRGIQKHEIGSYFMGVLACCSFLFSPPSFGQSNSSVPVPEYYGTYALANGKLADLTSPLPGGMHTLQVRVGKIQGEGSYLGPGAGICDLSMAQVSDRSLPEVPPDVQFLVYSQASGTLSPMTRAQSLKLGEVAYIRNVHAFCWPQPPRTGSENAWDFALDVGWVEMRIKPVMNRRDMVLVVPSSHLEPGIYSLEDASSARSFAFVVSPLSSAVAANCRELTVFPEGAMSQLGLRPCGNFSPTTASSASTPQPSTGVAPVQENSPSGWDKALSSGQPVSFSVCHSAGLGCEDGTFSLEAQEISFTKANGQKLFAVPPSAVTSIEAQQNPLISTAYFRLRAGGKNYNFYYHPVGVSCDIFGTSLRCPAQGVAQMVTVAEYVSQTIPKLASGVFAPPTPAAASASTPTAPANPVPCSQAADLGYSILLQGHLYKVKGAGPAGPNQLHLFFDEKGTQVTDLNLLQQLAPAAWTRENVIVSADARNGASRVSGILGTSAALQGYGAVQDVLARAMAEAVEAGVTGGASLSKAIRNITLGVLRSQLQNAPKTLFTLAAQRGLEMSASAYKQMEAVPLPPADATVLNAPDLVKVRNFYVQARSLELPYEALAAKLMPTSAAELTQQALASAISELIPSSRFNSTEQVTLKTLWYFQTSVGSLNTTVPALAAFSQNLNIALNLTAANNRTISQWATVSGTSCTQAGH